MMRWLWLLPILISGGYAGASGAAGVYGRPVPYALHQAVQYPDFSVRFLGTRREVISVYPRGFLYYDFEIFSRKRLYFAILFLFLPALACIPVRVFFTGGFFPRRFSADRLDQREIFFLLFIVNKYNIFIINFDYNQHKDIDHINSGLYRNHSSSWDSFDRITITAAGIVQTNLKIRARSRSRVRARARTPFI